MEAMKFFEFEVVKRFGKFLMNEFIMMNFFCEKSV